MDGIGRKTCIHLEPLCVAFAVSHMSSNVTLVTLQGTWNDSHLINEETKG